MGDGIEDPALMPARQGRKAIPAIRRSVGVCNERLINHLSCLRFVIPGLSSLATNKMLRYYAKYGKAGQGMEMGGAGRTRHLLLCAVEKPRHA